MGQIWGKKSGEPLAETPRVLHLSTAVHQRAPTAGRTGFDIFPTELPIKLFYYSMIRSQYTEYSTTVS